MKSPLEHLHPEAEDGSVVLAQLSDPHLFADRNNVFLGINPYDSLSAVLAQLAEESGVDALLASGDISQDHSAESYQLFTNMVDNLPLPVFALPGNHDLPSHMHSVLGASPVHYQRRVRMGNWQLLMLDSTVLGIPAGHVPLSELRWLQGVLEASTDTHTMVALHHHAVPTGCAWLDQHSLDNGAEFLSLLARYPQVKGVVWGHVHQEMDLMHEGIRLMAVPSTSIQFLPNSRGFVLDTQQPGYRLLRLGSDGSIDTQVKRLTGHEFVPDPTASGY
ncbi:3',5'-cyclic-AMP phosphodiesterase [Ferrimonas marina]|uniref:Icc protein n=1 Tax=Ferrimonas marina TaxID=299255 RepID=A0A1M5X7A7_9GAMM|nr:3',5'-cyclic-AMP phosphodiesterase [Ferrimonas marina]SHH95113.1 Icc protein [Ferrimonas marina]